MRIGLRQEAFADDAVAGEQDRGDLRGGASGQLSAEGAGLVQQFWMASHRSEIRTWLRFETTQTLLAIAGDLAASTLGLGYFASAVVFAVLFALPGLAYWRLHLNPIFAFWSAYVVTRPLGATVADWLGKPVLGGLGLGDGPVAAVLGVMIALCVVYLTRSRGDDSPAAEASQVRS